MKHLLFPGLALTGIKNNKKLYLPYIFSVVGCVTMYYLIRFLSVSEAVNNLKGGDNLVLGFSLGKYIVAAFSLIFLIYTNSFLARRRYKEFGLYNVLGMNKKDVSRIVIWETFFTALIGISAGVFFGVVLSKLAELGLLYFIKADIDFSFSLSVESVLRTVGIFAAVFAVLLIKTLFSIRKNDALELMSTANTGERPPKSNWFLAVSGVLILAAAYFIAVYIKSPLAALMLFFVAVLMVIAATYLLFISGSVVFCRLLQKNKKYYYKKNHFVSVSSMVYRMKRNGAGLASVCILSTMVIVMLASSASLYFGEENTIKSRFPRDNEITARLQSTELLTEENKAGMRSACEKVFEKHNVSASGVTEYAYAMITGALKDSNGSIALDPDNEMQAILSADSLRTLFFVSADDYNAAAGENVKVAPGETLVAAVRCDFDRDCFEMNGVKLNIAGKLPKMLEIGEANTGVVPAVLFVVNDMKEIAPLEELCTANGSRMLEIKWYYGYDLPFENQEAIDICAEQTDACRDMFNGEDADDKFGFYRSCIADQRADFYITFGGLFYIGILLSIVFLLAMTMIIYYKQISEGYEDAARFEIMKKVGMTEKDIKKSINSQILTVFFAPLLFAGLHFCFAFPPIRKILHLFNLFDLPLVIGVSAAVFVLFGAVYAAIYKATARAYYNIVSRSEDRI